MTTQRTCQKCRLPLHGNAHQDTTECLRCRQRRKWYVRKRARQEAIG